MDAKTLYEILDKHKKWIYGDAGGERADLSRADLSGANLIGADLSRADLSGADLSRANLSGADLSRADLIGADLSGAYLRRANLIGADLSRADLSRADLRGADMIGAYLNSKTKGLEEETLRRYFPIVCPEYGEFIGWKKAGCFIVKLKITENAKRSSAFGRKCRCSEAVVLAIENIDGTPSDKSEVFSQYDSRFVYRVGETASVLNFDDDRKNECAPGIHFFITRQEAEDY